MQTVEVIMRTERRRKFTDAFRRRVVVETENPDVTIISVAQKYDLAQSLVHKWRTKYLRRQDIVAPAPMLDRTVNSLPSWPLASSNEIGSDFVFAGQIEGGCVVQPQLVNENTYSNSQAQRIHVILPSGIKLGVGDQFNAVTLRRLIEVLDCRS